MNTVISPKHLCGVHPPRPSENVNGDLTYDNRTCYYRGADSLTHKGGESRYEPASW
jgi:hypothetical protein